MKRKPCRTDSLGVGDSCLESSGAGQGWPDILLRRTVPPDPNDESGLAAAAVSRLRSPSQSNIQHIP